MLLLPVIELYSRLAASVFFCEHDMFLVMRGVAEPFFSINRLTSIGISSAATVLVEHSNDVDLCMGNTFSLETGVGVSSLKFIGRIFLALEDPQWGFIRNFSSEGRNGSRLAHPRGHDGDGDALVMQSSSDSVFSLEQYAMNKYNTKCIRLELFELSVAPCLPRHAINLKDIVIDVISYNSRGGLGDQIFQDTQFAFGKRQCLDSIFPVFFSPLFRRPMSMTWKLQLYRVAGRARA